jgi:molybdate transport system regulatory protein
MNRCFREPVVDAQPGGVQGGGATLTDFGAELIRSYRAIEAEAKAATQARIAALAAALRGTNRQGAKTANKTHKTSIARSTRR